MIVIPAVDVLDHKVVQLVGGKPGTTQISIEDPYSVAEGWVRKGAQYLHLVDLDAAFGKGDNTDVFCDIIRNIGVPVEVGGGIRSADVIQKYVDAGAERIIVGTKAITDTEWLTEMADCFPNKLMVGMDMKGGRIAIKGWQESAQISVDNMFALIRELPVVAVLHTNIDVEGQEQGIDKEGVLRFCSQCPRSVIVSGGVTTESDIRVAAEAGAGAVVVGMALYKGNLRPWEFENPWSI